MLEVTKTSIFQLLLFVETFEICLVIKFIKHAKVDFLKQKGKHM